MTTQNENTRHLDIDDMERVRRYKQFYGGCVSDALHALGVDDTALSPKFRPLRQDMILAGSVVTAKMHPLAPWEPTEEQRKAREEERERLGNPQKRALGAVRPGSVLTFDSGGDTLTAQCGELMCTQVKARGGAGVLVGGNIRDTRHVLSMQDFAAFSLGTRANGWGGADYIEVQQPIFLPGLWKHYVEVNPGDFIFGDTDGVQIIPRELVDEVMLRCEETVGRENEIRKNIAEGMPLEEVFRRYGGL